jgi:hypothetical protein
LTISGALAYYGYRRTHHPKPTIKPPQRETKPVQSEAVVAARPTEKPPEAIPIAGPDISFEPKLQYLPGLIQLELTIVNHMNRMIEKVALKLIYDSDALEFKKISPKYPTKGDDILIGTLSPARPMRLTMDFEPMMLAVSEIEGVLIFKDSTGTLQTINIPAIQVNLQRPELLTDTNITTSKLMDKMTAELDYSGQKMFILSPDIKPQPAFELGKATIQRHDFRLVKEFAEKEPFVAEAWYFGKAKGADHKIVARVRYIGAKNVIDFLVLSSSAKLLTEMLLSLKADLVSELLANNLRPNISEINDPVEIKAISEMGTLLDIGMNDDH